MFTIPELDSLGVKRYGHICAGLGCTDLVHVHAHCDSCLTTAAINLAQSFEEQVQQHACWEGEEGFRAALAGWAQTLPTSWFETNSPLGKIAHSEASLLRQRTDQACLLVARGGVAALRDMENVSVPTRPAHYGGQAFDASVWDDIPVPNGVGDDLYAITYRTQQRLIGAAYGVGGVVALVAGVIGVMVWS